MNQFNQRTKKNAGLLGAIFGGLLVALPALPKAAVAEPVSKTNPCPGIYYQEPFNSRNLVPQGCPPNAVTRYLTTPGVTLSNQQQTPLRPIPGAVPLTLPLPEQQSNPIATVTPMNGTVDVKLKNNTNTRVTYEAVGHTDRRWLSAGEEVFLQNLPIPVTITSTRQDNGLLNVIPVASSQKGILDVVLDESNRLDNNLGALRIQKDGEVFLN